MQTNSAALKVVSQNIANLNTPNYTRRDVSLSALGANGIPAGVTIDDVRRVTDQYLTQEALSASSSSAQYNAVSSAYSKIGALLGSPGDGNSVSSKLSDVLAKLGSAQLSSSTSTNLSSVVSSLKSLASTVSTMSDQLDSLAVQANTDLASAVNSADSLIKQVYDYNQLVKSSTLQGNGDNAYLDQRATVLQKLSETMDIRVTNMDDGTIQVCTQDGISLVGNGTYAKLSYTTGANGVHDSIMLQDTSGITGQPIGTVQTLDGHVTAGSIRGLIDLRDTTIAGVKNELGSLTKGIANAFNEIHNESSSYPPPTTMTGHNTGLLATDSLNFSGQSRINLTNSSGVSQHAIDIDFTAGTISVDGGAATSFTGTVGGFTTALNSALSGLGGSATFSDGVLSVDGGISGMVIGDPNSASPSSRGGSGFSQFFGLNDLFTTSSPSITNTGMNAADVLGLSANGTISFSVKNAAGAVAKSVDVTITAGMTVGQAITAINTSLGGYATVSLDSNGALKTTMSAAYKDCALQVKSDTTTRGTTGISVSSLFGLGANTIGSLASDFKVNADVASSPSRLALARPNYASTQVVGATDTSGLQALQSLATQQVAFDRVGNLGAQMSTLQNYAASFYQDIATQSASATAAQTRENDRLVEAQTRQANVSGVNLDEELANMIMYQRAYSAGARLLTTVNQLYDSLFAIQ
jgi:flagellar hook-associated protein 1 FlgK